VTRQEPTASLVPSRRSVLIVGAAAIAAAALRAATGGATAHAAAPKSPNRKKAFILGVPR